MSYYESMQMTDNQSMVYEKLQKVIKRVRGIRREVPETTIDNFLTVFREDERFADLRFNQLNCRPEHVTTSGRREWTPADDASARGYMEKVYGMHSPAKWSDAFVQFQQEREYNPIQDRINAVKWDGIPRCESFLVKWMKAEDTPYNREVSRLLFAGAINRLYNPGCKFDCVPVLMGAQGGGKSTICHWLALEDDFYSSINTIEGQKGAEGIQGVWLCEIEELLAILASTKSGSAKEESAKAFISKQDEYYRQPYTKRPVHHPRQCIFIGTTNRDSFVTDKTGARRWFPVRVHSVAKELYDNQEQCKADILQAWAEMKAAYDRQDPLAYAAPRHIVESEIQEQQKEAACEDWQIGVIEKFLQGKKRVCLLQIWQEAFQGYGGGELKPKRSREIAEILVHQLGWQRGNTQNFGIHGRQKAYLAPSDTASPIAS